MKRIVKHTKYINGVAFGKSMIPLINPGDKLFIGKKVLKDIRVGDIVVFKDKNRYISHRIYKIRKNTLFPRGDNSYILDKPILYKDLVGTLIRIDGRYGVIDLENPWVRKAQYLFLLHSYITFIFPFFFFCYSTRLLRRIMRGRKIVVKFLAKKKRRDSV